MLQVMDAQASTMLKKKLRCKDVLLFYKESLNLPYLATEASRGVEKARLTKSSRWMIVISACHQAKPFPLVVYGPLFGEFQGVVRLYDDIIEIA